MESLITSARVFVDLQLISQEEGKQKRLLRPPHDPNTRGESLSSVVTINMRSRCLAGAGQSGEGRASGGFRLGLDLRSEDSPMTAEALLARLPARLN